MSNRAPVRNASADGVNVIASSKNSSQFAEIRKTEVDGLNAAALTQDVYWGDITSVRPGSRTPWGAAQIVEYPADGIAVVHCDGHGGIKLSPERNKAIPKPLRAANGWYEEDCASAIVGWVHPEAFPHYKDSDDERRDAFEKTVKNWYPDEFTKATGIRVSVDESSVLRERVKRKNIEAFRAEHANEFVSTNIISDTLNDEWLPDGYRLTSATRDATGEQRYFLLPEHEAVKNSIIQQDVLIDPNRHIDVTDVVNTKIDAERPYAGPENLPTVNDLGINYDNLTPAAAQRASEELGKRYRFDDGNGGTVVETFAEHLERVGVKSKSIHHAGDGKSSPVVNLASGGCYEVKKATFDALTALPDTTRRTTREAIAYHGALARLHKMSRFEDPAKYDKAQAKTEALHEAYRKARAEADHETRVWQDKMRAARKATFDRLIAERGIEF